MTTKPKRSSMAAISRLIGDMLIAMLAIVLTMGGVLALLVTLVQLG